MGRTKLLPGSPDLNGQMRTVCLHVTPPRPLNMARHPEGAGAMALALASHPEGAGAKRTATEGSLSLEAVHLARDSSVARQASTIVIRAQTGKPTGTNGTANALNRLAVPFVPVLQFPFVPVSQNVNTVQVARRILETTQGGSTALDGQRSFVASLLSEPRDAWSRRIVPETAGRVVRCVE